MALTHYPVNVTVSLRARCCCTSIELGFPFPLLRSMSTGNKRSLEDLWQDFFGNTSLWWDQRPEKINPRFPDFKHKQTQESLWVDHVRNPSWVEAKLAAVPPRKLQSNVFVWTQRLRRYVKAKQYVKTMEVFDQMQWAGINPNLWAFLPVLNACAGLGALEEGKRVHKLIIEVGCASNPYVASGLVNMYAKCGSIDDAWSVFSKMSQHDVVTWTAMIGGYVKSGQGLKALELFQKMEQEGVEPDSVTLVRVLNACASVEALEEGRRVHERVIQRGWESDVFVGSGLVDMYAKCGSIEEAWSVFVKMRKHDLVTWSAMIVGCVKSGQGLEAMELFKKMQEEGVQPNRVTYIGVLNACASVAALEEGRRVHDQIIRSGWESDVFVSNCLVDMYAKCGSIEDALRVFKKMPRQDVVAWNAMIGGYAMHGHAAKAIELFEQMVKESVQVDAITFTSLLSACSHGGLVKEGLRYFKSMTPHFSVHPTKAHYACMIDLLGRAGQLREAEELIKEIPVETDACLWTSLLGACRIYGNIEIAERAAQRCCNLDPENASDYVLLLSNTFSVRKQNGSAATKERLDKEVEKNRLHLHPGKLDSNSRIHAE